jgi:hypothetical protein
VTGDHEMGIGPADMVAGDHVCALFGGPTPYIVRPIDGKPGEYRLVGEYYIRKWMSGVALELIESGDVSTKWFKFR